MFTFMYEYMKGMDIKPWHILFSPRTYETSGSESEYDSCDGEGDSSDGKSPMGLCHVNANDRVQMAS